MKNLVKTLIVTMAATIAGMYSSVALSDDESWIIKCSSGPAIVWKFAVGVSEAEACISIGEVSTDCYRGDSKEWDFREGTGIGRKDSSWLVERWTTIKDGERIFRNHFVVKENGELYVEHVVYSKSEPGFNHSDWSGECNLENKRNVMASINST